MAAVNKRADDLETQRHRLGQHVGPLGNETPELAADDGVAQRDECGNRRIVAVDHLATVR